MTLRETLAGPALALTRAIGRARRDPGFRILLFHDLPPADRGAFARLIGELAAWRRLIGPAEAEAILSGRDTPPPGPPRVLLSFDDGFASNRAVAETILAPLGARALFFVCPGLIDLAPEAQAAAVSATILRGQRPAPEPLMGWSDLEALAAAGHVVANHTLTHPRLAGLTPDQRAEEIGGGAAILTRRLGPGDWFAYPFGDVGSIDAAALAEIGRHHRWCRSGVRGANHAATPPLALRADHVDLAASPNWRTLAVEGGLDPVYALARRRLDALADAAPEVRAR